MRRDENPTPKPKPDHRLRYREGRRRQSEWLYVHGVNVIPSDQDLKRFWKYVEKVPAPRGAGVSGPCWNWTGSRHSEGCGQFSLWGAVMLAHRFAYRMWVGVLNEENDVAHRCGNARCVNPEHLTETGRGQARRLVFPEHLAPTPAPVPAPLLCRNGHPWTPESTYLTARGTRVCRVCQREAYARKKGGKVRRYRKRGKMYMW